MKSKLPANLIKNRVNLPGYVIEADENKEKKEEDPPDMIVHILCGSNKPLRTYEDKNEAYDEYRRLQDMDDYVDYSVISMPVKPPPTRSFKDEAMLEIEDIKRMLKTLTQKIKEKKEAG